jgi:hypothetical protein
MIVRDQRSSRIVSWQDTELELNFCFSPQRTDPVPNFPRIGFPVKRISRCKAMNSKNKERSSPTDMRQERLVSDQALF